MLAQLKADPQMGDAEFRQIVALLESRTGIGRQDEVKPPGRHDDIDDEELFLYGDTDAPISDQAPADQPIGSQADLYGDVTEDDLYGDLVQPAAGSHDPR